ncbi:MAG: cell division protein FtsQ/DivIB [Nevskiales bacterium]
MSAGISRLKYLPVPLLTVVAVVWLLTVYAPQRLGPLSGPVHRLVIEGELHHLNDPELIRAVRPYLGARFFELDVSAIQAAVSKLPWVQSVAVRKHWPNAVALHLYERVPAARWHEAALVTAQGEVFTPLALDGSVLGLPRLRGPDPLAAPVLLQALARWQTALTPVTARIDELSLDARGAWSVQLASGPTLQLGRDDMDPRLRRYAQVVVPALGARLAEVTRVDLRYSNGFAVAWRPQLPATKQEEQHGEKA